MILLIFFDHADFKSSLQNLFGEAEVRGQFKIGENFTQYQPAVARVARHLDVHVLAEATGFSSADTSSIQLITITGLVELVLLRERKVCFDHAFWRFSLR